MSRGVPVCLREMFRATPGYSRATRRSARSTTTSAPSLDDFLSCYRGLRPLRAARWHLKGFRPQHFESGSSYWAKGGAGPDASITLHQRSSITQPVATSSSSTNSSTRAASRPL
jgi:hypothetical protein